jgi:hypothetical protein
MIRVVGETLPCPLLLNSVMRGIASYVISRWDDYCMFLVCTSTCHGNLPCPMLFVNVWEIIGGLLFLC